MMFKKCLLVVVFTVYSIEGYSANSYQALQTAAEEFADYYMHKDVGHIVELTHPKVVEVIGGEDSLNIILKTMFKSLEQEGGEIIKMQFEQPRQFTEISGNLHAIVPYTGTMQFDDRAMKISSYYLAWSGDEGAHWFFIDGAQLTQERLRHILPYYNNELYLPEPYED